MDVSEEPDLTDIENWTTVEVSQWILKHFNAETAGKFKEQNIKGSLLKYMAANGTVEQLKECGLDDIGSQLEFQRLVRQFSQQDAHEVIAVPPSPSCYSSSTPSSASSKKPSRNALKSMSVLDAKIYKAKRRTVQERAVKRWPGNAIPIFRKNKTALNDLEHLVNELAESCTYAPAGFGKDGIRQHILDTLNERRRRIHKGHDYDKGDGRGKKAESNTKVVQEKESVGLNVAKQKQRPLSAKKGKFPELPKEYVDTDKSLYESDKNKDEAKSSGSEEDEHDESEMEDDGNGLSSSGDEMETPQQSNFNARTVRPAAEMENMSVKSAALIISVAFQAINIKSITRTQLQSASKTLNLKLKCSSKEEFLVPLATALIDAGYIKIKKGGSNLQNLIRNEIIRLKAF